MRLSAELAKVWESRKHSYIEMTIKAEGENLGYCFNRQTIDSACALILEEVGSFEVIDLYIED